MMREILAEELMRIDDDATAYVTVTEVEVDNELTRAKVFLAGPDLADELVAGVEAHTGRLRKAVSQRANLRHTPRLEFFIDPGVQSGARIDEILRNMADDRAFTEESQEEE